MIVGKQKKEVKSVCLSVCLFICFVVREFINEEREQRKDLGNAITLLLFVD